MYIFNIWYEDGENMLIVHNAHDGSLQNFVAIRIDAFKVLI